MPLIFNEVWIRSQALTRLEQGQLRVELVGSLFREDYHNDDDIEVTMIMIKNSTKKENTRKESQSLCTMISIFIKVFLDLARRVKVIFSIVLPSVPIASRRTNQLRDLVVKLQLKISSPVESYATGVRSITSYSLVSM